MVAPPLGSPIAAAGIGSFRREQSASLAIALRPPQTAESNTASTALAASKCRSLATTKSSLMTAMHCLTSRNWQRHPIGCRLAARGIGIAIAGALMSAKSVVRTDVAQFLDWNNSLQPEHCTRERIPARCRAHAVEDRDVASNGIDPILQKPIIAAACSNPSPAARERAQAASCDAALAIAAAGPAASISPVCSATAPRDRPGRRGPGPSPGDRRANKGWRLARHQPRNRST
jgi:hypothetical protein